jgi:hypothetical protein
MKRTALALSLILALVISTVAGTQLFKVTKANPGIPSEIPPIVAVPEMYVNATISRVNGTLWARVDAAYPTETIYAFGDSYRVSTEAFWPDYPPVEVTITVAYDRIDAYYPIPLNATNISLKMDGAELDWAYRARDFFHLFDIDLPELKWTISPVPTNFSLTAHYEHPVPATGTTYAYLGNYAFLFAFGSRYGLDSIAHEYPGYSWSGWVKDGSPVVHFNIEMEPILANISAYAIDNRGTLTQLNHTISTEKSTERLEFTISRGAGETAFPFGVVVVFDEAAETSEPFLATLVAASALSVAAVSTGLFVYFRKRNRKTAS